MPRWACRMDEPKRIEGRKLVSGEQVRELLCIGGATRSHRSIARPNGKQLVLELSVNRAWLGQRNQFTCRGSARDRASDLYCGCATADQFNICRSCLIKIRFRFKFAGFSRARSVCSHKHTSAHARTGVIVRYIGAQQRSRRAPSLSGCAFCVERRRRRTRERLL